MKKKKRQRIEDAIRNAHVIANQTPLQKPTTAEARAPFLLPGMVAKSIFTVRG